MPRTPGYSDQGGHARCRGHLETLEKPNVVGYHGLLKIHALSALSHRSCIVIFPGRLTSTTAWGAHVYGLTSRPLMESGTTQSFES